MRWRWLGGNSSVATDENAEAFYLLYSQQLKNVPPVGGENSSPVENQIVPQTEGQLPAQILPQVGRHYAYS